MTVLHSGTTNKYSTNWEKAFGKKRSAEGTKSSAKRIAARPPRGKPAAKKKGKSRKP
jgi:hypothetical protein